MGDVVKLLYSVFKLRIGVAITLTALAGLAVTPGPGPAGWQIVVLAIAVLASSAAAGAFNQYVERDLDARMGRTRNRPFVTGRFRANGYWLAGIGVLLLTAVAGAALAGLVVFVFLRNLRSTVIVILAIPLAILAALIGLFFSGDTINAMTLGGLALAVGILLIVASVEHK
jgi:heme O synthase-like polyprenyltransferase